MRVRTFVTAVSALAITSGTCLACVTPPPEPPRRIWVDIHGDTDGDGRTEAWVGVEVGIFPFSSPTGCACGIGLSANSTTLVPSLDISGAMVGFTNTTTHTTRFISEFAFQNNAAAAGALSNASPQQGLNWTGFSGLIAPIGNPTPEPGEVAKLWFMVTFDTGELSNFIGGEITALFANGEADPATGLPLLSGPHATVFHTALDPTVPAPPMLTALAGLGLIASRRRR